MLAYHWLNDDMHASHGIEPPWVVGEERTLAKGDRARICEWGYHSSPSLYEALNYASGLVACLVDVNPPRKTQYHSDKQVSRRRKLIAAKNVSKELDEWLAWCTQSAANYLGVPLSTVLEGTAPKGFTGNDKAWEISSRMRYLRSYIFQRVPLHDGFANFGWMRGKFEELINFDAEVAQYAK